MPISSVDLRRYLGASERGYEEDPMRYLLTFYAVEVEKNSAHAVVQTPSD